MTSTKKNINPFGLILTGGGARGAYQAGVLKGIADILSEKDRAEFPFRVLSGSSSGAINCSFLACGKGDFPQVTDDLANLWAKIQFSDIYETNSTNMGRLSFRWAKGLGFAGMGASSAPNYLLDTSPLFDLIQREINFANLKDFEKKNRILAINTTNYQTGAAITFFSDTDHAETWIRNYRFSMRTQLTATHVLASAAIPVLFPPVKIGNSFYGDGALRMKSPFSPVIHLGAEKVLAIGVRKPTRPEDLLARVDDPADTIHLSDVVGAVLNSVFLDSLNSDLERLERINETLTLLKDEHVKDYPLKPIEVLTIQPSEDLGLLAKGTIPYFPRTIRYLLHGIGASENRGSELLSYLSFHPSYTEKLIALGAKDAWTQSEEVINFFT